MNSPARQEQVANHAQTASGYDPTASGRLPMTATLMGRLFIVPALIVCVMLAVAVVVVLFGASSIEQPGSIEDLLSAIEADPGARTSIGLSSLLLPQAKKAVQAARVLPERLEKVGPSLNAESADSYAGRIVLLIEKDAERAEAVKSSPGELEPGHHRKPFLVAALGHLRVPGVIEPLIEALRDDDEQVRKAAILGLANARDVKGVDKALPDLYAILEDGTKPEVQMIASLAVASLADSGDGAAIQRLADLLGGDREVQWNAAMALARLGSPRGKLVMMNMLDRAYWANLDLRYEEDQAIIERKLSDIEISNRLCAAIRASVYMNDRDIDGLIEQLGKHDDSHLVREAARQALDHAADMRANRRVQSAADKPAHTSPIGGDA